MVPPSPFLLRLLSLGSRSHQPGLPTSSPAWLLSMSVCPVMALPPRAQAWSLCAVEGQRSLRGLKSWSSARGDGHCLGAASGVRPGIYKGEAGVPCSTLRAQGEPGPEKVGSSAAAEPWARPGQETGPLGRTRTVLPKHLSVSLMWRGRPLWIKSLSCGCTFSEAEVSRGACVQGRAVRGTSRAPLEKARRSLDTTTAGETCLHGLPAHSPQALLVSGILTPWGPSVGTPPCFKDVLNVFDLEHVSQDPR